MTLKLCVYLVEWNIVPRTKELCDKLTQELVDNSLFHAMLQLWGGITSGLDGARNRSGRLGIVIKQEHWGRGYAQEAVEGLLDYAFDNLGYHRVGLNVSAGNTRAINCMRKSGSRKKEESGKYCIAMDCGKIRLRWQEAKKGAVFGFFALLLEHPSRLAKIT
ncbi:acyl-CoA N-acyltransferase, partial [Flagelloscypha sp. PMI_526]